MIEIKSHFHGWREVTESQALRFAARLYNGMVCRNKLEEVHKRIRGIEFTKEQLIDEIERINDERMREGA